MAGWRFAFCVGNSEVVGALAKLKSYLDYGTFQPIQIAATVVMNEESDYPREVNEIYQSRRDSLIRGLARIGWELNPPRERCLFGLRSRSLTVKWVPWASVSILLRKQMLLCRLELGSGQAVRDMCGLP
ncbi:MAG: hypothetical protein Ct9H300mP26_4810 [Acidimicrobiales bacterium]|nr:MAG: hypothetical protein Ct9H300mP26_4810 [Acidimicrobiales bacterium]